MRTDQYWAFGARVLLATFDRIRRGWMDGEVRSILELA